MTGAPRPLGVVGTTMLGRQIARTLVHAGHSIAVLDADRDCSPEAEACSAHGCASVAELIELSDLVITSVADDEELDSIAASIAGLPARRSTRTLIDASPVLPSTIVDVAARLGAHGITVVGAALIASRGGGIGTAFVDGAAAGTETVRSVMTSLAPRVVATRKLGHSKALRILENLLLGVNSVAAAEALALAGKTGLPAELVVPLVLKGSGASAAIRESDFEARQLRDRPRDGRTIDRLRTDLNLALRLGSLHQQSVFFGALSLNACRGASALGLGHEHPSALIRWLERSANMPEASPHPEARCR